MWQLCKPGVAAAAWQLFAILVLTGIGLVHREHVQLDEPTARVLSWAFTLTALGVIFTNAVSLQQAAERIRNASRRMNPSNPNQAATIVLVQLAIGTLGFLALLLARGAVVDERAGSSGNLVIVAQSAVYSIAVAGLGTMVRAARKAVAHR